MPSRRRASEELDHDFLWRIAKALPERGRIGIFNRSHYEEVLVVRVHPEILARQRLPDELVGKDIWDERFKEHPRLRAPPRAQRRAGPEVLPACLEGRAAPALPRAARGAGQALEVRRWATSPSASSGTSTCTPTRTRSARPAGPEAPWYVVPADNKWFARLVIAAAMVEAMEGLRAGISQGRRAGAEGARAGARRAAGGIAEAEVMLPTCLAPQAPRYLPPCGGRSTREARREGALQKLYFMKLSDRRLSIACAMTS